MPRFIPDRATASSCWLTSGLWMHFAPQANAAPAVDLCDGVHQIKLPGQVGALAVYGPAAFAVVAAQLKYETNDAAIIAAGSYGNRERGKRKGLRAMQLMPGPISIGCRSVVRFCFALALLGAPELAAQIIPLRRLARRH